MPSRRTALKRVLLGSRHTGRQLRRELLPKRLALPVLASDHLSSVAYASQEMLLVLALAGAGALALVGPLSAGVVVLLAVVVLNYRESLHAYPHRGGAYIVARDNLGQVPGLVAAATLLVDYVLRVAVSAAAGAAAMLAVAPQLGTHRTWVAVAAVVAASLLNLRIGRQAGTIAALPVYLFVATMLALIATGIVRCLAGGCPPAPSAGQALEPVGAATALLALRAFGVGAAALTGVETVSNGVGALRYPQSRNAATVLGINAALTAVLFLGVSYLASATGVVASADAATPLVAEVALAVFGPGPLFWLTQLATAGVLLFAANTAFADLPRLGSVLAGDRFLPRQLMARGERVVFANGILLIGAGAIALVLLSHASVSQLVVLYVIVAFTSFTLSQASMVRHHRRLRGTGWRRAAAQHGAGALGTAAVLVAAATGARPGDLAGAVLVVALLVWGMQRVRGHYAWTSTLLAPGAAETPQVTRNHVVLVLDRVDEPAARALSYVRSLVPASLEAVATTVPGSDLERRWHQLAPEVGLTVLDAASGTARAQLRAVDRADAVAETLHQRALAYGSQATTAVLPEKLTRSWGALLRENRTALRLRSGLLAEPGVVVTDFPSPAGGPGPYTIEDPAEHHVLVLVSEVDHATLRALAYAQGLHASTLRALSVSVDPTATRRLLEAWESWEVGVALEVIDSPFREFGATLPRYVREFAPDGRSTIVTCVLPRLVLPRWRQAPLHNQTASVITSALLFERGVVITSVPTPIPDPRRAGADG